MRTSNGPSATESSRAPRPTCRTRGGRATAGHVFTTTSDDLVSFGEGLLAILDRGSFTSTYKYAVLMALLDLALESTQKDGAAPTMVTTRQLATRVIELYWPQTKEFAEGDLGRVLGQNLPQRDKRDQAEVLRRIQKFREDHAGRASPHRARLEAKAAWEALLTEVEWKLVEMPLPRLQIIGGQLRPFLYQINWGTDISRRHFKSNEFDNRILFMPGAAEHMVRLAGLLRPLIQREWSSLVARFNGLPSARLEDFLFGVDRSELAKVRVPLFELQEAQCFYCARALKADAMEVDHFIPWARHPNDAIENLVGAHAGCNASKSDYLAAPRHLERWVQRLQTHAQVLRQIGDDNLWESAGPTTFSIARGIYLRLPEQTPLWEASQHFSAASRAELRSLLAA